VNPTNNFLL